ncbi:MAG: hypothetical protein G01um101416_301 [Microgenomates group bacterium Gr01-1014_16]|nr:MAG: hypothetical protein G01um101416_301 [Microgenomates group bacterium Gr01-1014_16]
MPGDIKIKLDRVVDTLVRGYRPEKVILFGSMARGDFGEDSDFDLLIIKDGVDDVPVHDRHVEVRGLLPDDTAVDALVYSPKELKKRLYLEDPFVLSVFDQGKVLYGT